MLEVIYNFIATFILTGIFGLILAVFGEGKIRTTGVLVIIPSLIGFLICWIALLWI